jgi:hypothetical protein
VDVDTVRLDYSLGIGAFYVSIRGKCIVIMIYKTKTDSSGLQKSFEGHIFPGRGIKNDINL